ncbi:MAG: hypothetical protein LBE56_10520 [Tannerella sp.]|jgi:aspartyl-tRNA(Asn)/glutamyl-tRNA(Gln) amidotransferase subunit A|nr:hypothetical protein [Tannerella sp.]
MESEIFTLHHELVSKQRSCYEIVTDKLTAVAVHEDLLLSDEALATASAVDKKIAAGEHLGLLEGIPFGVQEMLMLQNTVGAGGTDFLQNYTSPYTATAVQQLLDAGAIPVVKQRFNRLENHSDCGFSAFDIAKRHVAFSIGDDDGGIVRQSAGYAHAYGFKPTFGRVSRWGSTTASSTSCISPIASSLEDIRLLLNVISGKDRNDVLSFDAGRIPETVFDTGYLHQNVKIGYFKNFIENDATDEAVKNDFHAMIERLSAGGIDLIPLDFFDLDILVSTFYVLSMAETASNSAKFDGTVYGLGDRSANLPEETKHRIIAGSCLLSDAYDEDVRLKAQKIKAAVMGKLNECFENVDIILSPVNNKSYSASYNTDTLDPEQIHSKIPENYMQDAFTVAFSLAGLPALSAPFFLPTGIQITANKNREDLILHVAQFLKERQ